MPNLPHDFYAMSQRKRRKDKTPHLLYKEKILRVIFVECYVERLLELNLWSFWKVVSILCRFVTGQVRSKCDLLYYSSENVLFDLCWPFLTNEKITGFLTLDSCRGYFVLPVARVKRNSPQDFVGRSQNCHSVWQISVWQPSVWLKNVYSAMVLKRMFITPKQYK